MCSSDLTEITLPEGSEVPGLTDETDQMVVSVNAPKAVEEDPVIDDELEDGEEAEGDDAPEETDSAPQDSEENKDDSSEKS